MSPLSNSSLMKRKKASSYYEKPHEGKQTHRNLKKIFLLPDFEDLHMLAQTLSEHFLFYNVPQNQRTQLIACLDAYQCSEKVQIFCKDEPGSLFFIIRSGTVEVELPKEGRIKLLRRGECFGDLALIYSTLRSATVRSVTGCTFYCISHTVFRRVVQQIIRKNFLISKRFIQNAGIFKFLTKKQKNQIAYNTLVLRYENDQVIFSRGEDANGFYSIIEGKVVLDIEQKDPLIMKEGQSFGENSLEEYQVREGTAITIEETTLLAIGREGIRRCLGKHLKQLSFQNILRWSLSRDQFFQKISTHQRQKLLSQFEIKYFKDQEIICHEGDIAEFLIVVLEEYVNGGSVGTFFNTEYLLPDEESNQRITERLTKDGSGHVGRIAFEQIYNILGRNLTELSSATHIYSNLKKQISKKRNEYLQKLTLSSFLVRLKISETQYEDIYEVEDRVNKIYTMRCFKKRQVLQDSLQNFILNEKEVLSIADSPFIAKLYRTFEDPEHLFFLTNHAHGMDFFDILKQIGSCNREQAQFFIGCLILAVEHLHENNIIHRDLKPENIIISESGYLNLVDLKLSKILSEEAGFRTFTISGTPHYMAPQLIEVHGYSFSADLWSLGVVFYEISFGKLPFGQNTTDPYEIFQQIRNSELAFDPCFQDEEAKELMGKLLSKNLAERMIEDFSEIKNLRYFKNFAWDDLMSKVLLPPFKLKAKEQKFINQPLCKFLKKQKSLIADSSIGPPPNFSWGEHI